LKEAVFIFVRIDGKTGAVEKWKDEMYKPTRNLFSLDYKKVLGCVCGTTGGVAFIRRRPKIPGRRLLKGWVI